MSIVEQYNPEHTHKSHEAIIQKMIDEGRYAWAIRKCNRRLNYLEDRFEHGEFRVEFDRHEDKVVRLYEEAHRKMMGI